MLVPMALISGGLAPVVGRLIDRVNPNYIAGAGLVCMPVALFWLGRLMHPDAADLAVAAADRRARRRQRAVMWAPLELHGHPQPAAAPGRRRGRASTTPPARSAPCSAAPPSRS